MYRTLYESMARIFARADHWTFMNYGYVDQHSPDLSAADHPERYPAYLYHYVVSQVDLRNRDVLEVGSGRGGGAAYVMRHLGPRRVLGVDIAQSAIEFCRRVHRLDGLEFVTGDAEALPVPDRSFDVVLNVESSHCYPSLERFLAEVSRVLRPGGYFLYTDIYYSSDVYKLEETIAGSGLALRARTDITQGVLTGLARDGSRRENWCAKTVPRLLHGPVHKFAGVGRTRVPVALANGRERYLNYVLQKPNRL